jgi:hypothetical protein
MLRVNLFSSYGRRSQEFWTKRRLTRYSAEGVLNVLVAGDKSGGSQGRFYRRLIAQVDLRYVAHLERLRAMRTKEG